jgi:beta-lactamase regulating signal transducer with metallopeptidase domain
MTTMLLLKVTCVLALGLGAMPLLRQASSSLRSGVLTLTLAAAAVVPVLVGIAPGWGPHPAATAAWASEVQGNGVVVWIWMLGAALQLATLLGGLARLVRVTSRASQCDDARLNDLALEISAQYHLPRPVRLLISDCPLAPLTWGHWQPEVLLPPHASTWDDERATVVLRHELAHIRRRDWLTQLLGAMARTIVWWHPLVWLLMNRLRRESEYACDAHVIADGLSAHQYATHLLELARAGLRGATPLPAASLASRSMLESRVRRLLDARASRAVVTNVRERALAFVAAAVAAIAVAGYGSRSQLGAGPVVIPLIPEKPVTLTLLLDGRMVDLSKYVPPLPDPNAGVIEGSMFPASVTPASSRIERTF